MRPVIYTGKVDLGGSGIGNTATHHVDPLSREGLLEEALVESHTDKYNTTEYKGRIASIKMPDADYITQDLLFDSLVSLSVPRVQALHSWLSHSLFTALSNNFEEYIVNCFSAHTSHQRQLIQSFTGQNLVHPFSEKKMVKEMQLATRILTPSEFVFNSLKRYGLESKAKIIPFGVDSEKFKPGEKKDDVFRVLFIGRNWLRKGLVYLIKAWDALSLENAELHIITSAVPEDLPTRSMKIEEWVENLQATYHNADVFCLPTVEDGNPLCVLEALASGLPAVVSNNNGASQYIWNGSNGFVVDTGDVSALANRIKELYDNRDELEYMKGKARESALAWTWERYENEYLNWIKQILDKTI